MLSDLFKVSRKRTEEVQLRCTTTNQPMVGWIGGWFCPQPIRVQITDLTPVFLI